MWLVTCEDDGGMWMDDPIAADTEEEATRIALEQWGKLSEGYTLVLYECHQKKEIERPVHNRK